MDDKRYSDTGPAEGERTQCTPNIEHRCIFKLPDSNNTQTRIHIQSISLCFVHFLFFDSFSFATIFIDTLFDWTKNEDVDWIKFNLLVHVSVSVHA